MLVATELGHYVEDSGAKVAIAGQELYERLSGLLGENGLSHIVVAAYSDYLEVETDLEIPDVVRAPREEIEDGGRRPLERDAFGRAHSISGGSRGG
jgi:fatty-acyl-CoA synthase